MARSKAARRDPRSPDERRAEFVVIPGGAPADWTPAEIRRLCYPTVKALPFVKSKPNAEPMWMPETFWSDEPTGNYARDATRGREFAHQAVEAAMADGCPRVIAHIIDDIIRDGVKRATMKGRRKRSPAAHAFVSEIGAILATALNRQ